MDTEVTSSDFVSPEIWSEIPPEIWRKILSMVHNPCDPKSTTEKRLVCQIWRDVIDEHLDFELKFDDNDITTKLNIPPHVRASTWVITNLIKTTNLDELISHQKGSLVKDLRLVGLISAKNFQTILKVTPNVDGILLNDLSFSQNGVMEPVAGKEQEFTAFCSKLKNIALNVANFKSIEKVFQLNLSKLSKCCLTVNVAATYIKQQHRYTCVANFMDSLFRFLETMPSLKTFKMSLRICGMFNHTVNSSLSRERYPEIKMPDVQFEYLELAVAIPLLYFWGPVIRKQNKLKSLSVLPLRDTAKPNTQEKICLYKNIFGGLEASEDSLTSIWLHNIYAESPVNASIFRNMQNLRTLKLVLVFETGKSEIHNLSSLPSSLQDLMLMTFSCQTDDLLEMAENLINIRYIQLINFKVKNQFSEDEPELGINKKVIVSLASKKHIVHMSLSRVKLNAVFQVGDDDDFFYLANDCLKREIRMKVDEWGGTLSHSFI